MLDIKLFNYVLKNSKSILPEKMPILVRTDIMDPSIYLNIELKYRPLIQLLYHSGGYAFYGQIYKMLSSKTKAFVEITKMEEMGIVGSTTLNKNSYVYLQDNGLKYAIYKENYEILTHIDKIKLPDLLVGSSSDIPLKSSSAIVEYNLNYLEQHNGDCKLNINQDYEVFLSKRMALFWVNKLNTLIGRFSVEDITPNIKTMFERSRIYLAFIKAGEEYIDSLNIKPDIKDILFRFVIFDFGNLNEKSIINCLIKISKFLNLFGYVTPFESSMPDNIKIDMDRYQGVKVNKYNFELEICTANTNRIEIIRDMVRAAEKDIKSKNEFILKAQSDNKYISYNSKEELTEKKEMLKEQYISGFKGAIVNDKISDVDKYFKHPLAKAKGIFKSQDIDRMEELRRTIKNQV